MVTANIIQRVFLVNSSTGSGTGFTIEHNGTQYLISARHIFEPDWDYDVRNLKDRQEITISIYRDNEWVELNSIIYLSDNKDVDVIIFSLEKDLSPRHPISYDYKGLVQGQSMFFLGFPYGKFFPDKFNINSKFPIPFVKKAICSTLQISRNDGWVFYLDGHTNPGFSGGPIVFFDFESRGLKIAGVMRGCLPHEGQVPFEQVNEEGELERQTIIYDENSGIIIIQAFEEVRKILLKIK